jgi:hypothetical protein
MMICPSQGNMKINPKTAQFTIWNVSFELNLDFIGSRGSDFSFNHNFNMF